MTKKDRSKKEPKYVDMPINVGDELHVNVRSRVVQLGKDKSGLDVARIAMDELLINGIVEAPVTFWAPIMLIQENVAAVKADRKRRAADTRHTPLELPNNVSIPKELPDVKPAD